MSILDIFKNSNPFFEDLKSRFINNEMYKQCGVYDSIIYALEKGVVRNIYNGDKICYNKETGIIIRKRGLETISSRIHSQQLLSNAFLTVMYPDHKILIQSEYRDLIDWIIKIKENILFMSKGEITFDKVQLLEDEEHEDIDLHFTVTYSITNGIIYPRYLIKKYNPDFFFKNIENTLSEK